MQTSTDVTEARRQIKALRDEAIAHAKRAEAATGGVAEKQEEALFEAWQAGSKLNALKPLIGHGNWQAWLESNYCKPARVTYRTAALYMKIDADNPNVQRVADLKFDTIRKYAMSFVPEKKKPKLKGDVGIGALTHHLKWINAWFKWRRRAETEQIERNRDEEKRDCRDVLTWMCDEIYVDEVITLQHGPYAGRRMLLINSPEQAAPH